MDTRHHALTILHLLHEQSHPIPSIPFSLQQGFTHSWMGETWMVDGEALVMMIATISSNSLSRQGARTEFLTPGRGFAMAAEFRKGIVKVIIPSMFLGQKGLSSRKSVARGCSTRPHHVVARPRFPHAATWCGRVLAPLHLLF